MKTFSLLLLSLFLMLALAACESRKPTDTTQLSDTTAVQPAKDEANSAVFLTPRLQTLGLRPDYDWQQVRLGDDFTALKASTKAEPFEQDVQHIGYSNEFDNLESVDYQYFQANGKINKIQVDLYLNSAQSVADYRKELVAYFDAKYGTSGKTAQEVSWQQGRVTVKNVSKGKDYGLRIVIQ